MIFSQYFLRVVNVYDQRRVYLRVDYLTALFLQIWGKGPGPFKRGKFLKLGKKSHSQRKIDNVLELNNNI